MYMNKLDLLQRNNKYNNNNKNNNETNRIKVEPLQCECFRMDLSWSRFEGMKCKRNKQAQRPPMEMALRENRMCQWNGSVRIYNRTKIGVYKAQQTQQYREKGEILTDNDHRNLIKQSQFVVLQLMGIYDTVC